MNVTCYYECPQCFKEVEIEYELGENFCCFDSCPECGHTLTDNEETAIFTKLSEQAYGSATDRATDYLNDR